MNDLAELLELARRVKACDVDTAGMQWRESCRPSGWVAYVQWSDGDRLTSLRCGRPADALRDLRETLLRLLERR